MNAATSGVQIKHLYISPGHNFVGHHEKTPGEHPMIDCPEITVRARCGIEGDRYFNHKPDGKGQITFFSHEVFERLCEQFGQWDLSPSIFRRNVITRGADLNLWIGREFEIQGVRFLGTEESRPCYWMDRVLSPGAREAMEGFGGLRAKVLIDGTLKAG